MPEHPGANRSLLRLAAILAATAGLAACEPQKPQPARPAPADAAAPSKGPLRVTRGAVDFRNSPHAPAGKTWVYQIHLPFQVAKGRAGSFANLREAGAPGIDFEIGADVVLFDNLANGGAVQAVPLARNHEEPNPHSKPPGQAAMIVKYPVRGGFVPFGALRADGSPQPHAGTGFAVNQAIAWRTEGLKNPPFGMNMFRGPETYQYFEVHQLTYDGTTFRVVKTDRVGLTELVPGWTILDGGMTNAIADGDDFLVGMTGGKIDAAKLRTLGPEVAAAGGAGVMRWRREGDLWRAVDFVSVTGDDGAAFEPSLIRDVDGSLLFGARGSQELEQNDIRIWRSKDGRSWEKVVHVRGVVSSAPISLNQAADGTPYVVSNVYEVFMHTVDRLQLRRDSQGRVRGGGWTRITQCVWPVSEDRSSLGIPIRVRESWTDFGAPPGGTTWLVDHPSGAVLHLADGKWHGVLASRVMELAEYTYSMAPTAHTGAYLEEVVSAGEPRAVWKF